jgi:hypothetical protein
VGWKSGEHGAFEPLAQWMTRRRFLKALAGTALGAAAIGAGGFYMSRVEPGWLDLTNIRLGLPRLDPVFAGFRLVQISDIHLSEVISGKQVAEACQMALDAHPDLVALTGDFVDVRAGFTGLLSELASVLRPLVQSVQTVAILGNHDYRMGSVPIRRMLNSLQIQELYNEVLVLRRGDARFAIAGVDDIMWGCPQLDQVIKRLPSAGAAVLLAHEPDYADISARTGRFDLQISGHSHGGQVVFPLTGAPVLPELGRKYPEGLYRVGSMLQYTNRGLGMTRPYIRLNCRPEVTVFTFSPEFHS